jgi:hypothetical protein
MFLWPAANGTTGTIVLVAGVEWPASLPHAQGLRNTAEREKSYLFPTCYILTPNLADAQLRNRRRLAVSANSRGDTCRDQEDIRGSDVEPP